MVLLLSFFSSKYLEGCKTAEAEERVKKIMEQETQGHQESSSGLQPTEGKDLIKRLPPDLPGGIHQCRYDSDLTLLSMSDGFLTMIGYTQEEMEVLFHNHYIELIYPADREAVRRTIEEQLRMGNDTEVEYRILQKNGAPVWILDKGRKIPNQEGGFDFYCILLEITARKNQEEELRLSLERHRVIMDQATDIIFEWDIKADTLLFSANWFKKFGYPAIDSDVSRRIPRSQNIHEDDREACRKIIRDTMSGVPYSEAEIRIRDKGGIYYWNRIRTTTQYDSDGAAVKVIGVVTDVDTDKKQRQALMEQAQRDTLTGLYNKAATNALVAERIRGAGGKRQAVLILDIDYFKEVNDTYGHLVGDSILSDVATAMRRHMREGDVAGRIGGDEFLAYLSEGKDEAELRERVERLLAELGGIRPRPEKRPVSCSIGVVLFSGNCEDYRVLIRQADQALYHRKHVGRGGYSLYDSDLDEKERKATKVTVRTAVNEEIDFNRRNIGNGQLAQYAFRTLYQSEQVEETLERLLEIIGRSYDVSRVYIFENSEDGAYCSNTFEWCNTGIEPQMSRLQKLSYHDDLEDYDRVFEKEGVVYWADISELRPNMRKVLEPQGIRSMLHCAMVDEGEFAGFIGFDECRENREWSPGQVDTFRLTADIFSVFLIKLRQKQRLLSEKWET